MKLNTIIPCSYTPVNTDMSQPDKSMPTYRYKTYVYEDCRNGKTVNEYYFETQAKAKKFLEAHEARIKAETISPRVRGYWNHVD